MKKYILPNDFFPAPQSTEKICLYDYIITDPNHKNQITLTKNVFSFLMEGNKELVHFDKQTTIETQQFLLIKAGKCLMTEHLSTNNHYRSFLLFFDDDAIFNFIEKHKIEIKTNAKNKPFCVFDYDGYIKNFVESIVQLNKQKTALRNLVLPVKLEELFLYLVDKNGTEFLSNFVHCQDNFKNHFASVIDNNIYNDLSIEELAFLCNTSVSTFKRAFIKSYEQSPIKWFQEKRLEHSAFLLEHKKMRPSDIFEEIGYENLSSFVQAYKKKFGKTPKQHFA